MKLKFVIAIVLCCVGLALRAQENATRNVKVYGEEGKFAGWPANWGMWNWGNEILVGYTKADHEEKKGHTYKVESSIAQFSRSYDGGKTWVVEDAFDRGITHATWEHTKGNNELKVLKEKINFEHPDFALTFRMQDALWGPTSFYYTYNRGKSWIGPFPLDVKFTGPKPEGIVSRTDYVVDGKNKMTAFVTVGFKDGEAMNWRQVACIETRDGGKTWKQKSWIGEPRINSIMPASFRVDKNTLVSVIRRTKPPRMVSFLSKDNGKTWTPLEDPVKVDANGHPPAIVKVQDGRMCMVYGIRNPETMEHGVGMYVVFSKDNGLTWGEPSLLRGNDGGSWDIGYPRAVILPDGKVVATYYYNQSGEGDKYRFIAATIFNPADYK